MKYSYDELMSIRDSYEMENIRLIRNHIKSPIKKRNGGLMNINEYDV